jgi:hypothetical protein
MVPKLFEYAERMTHIPGNAGLMLTYSGFHVSVQEK